jgi:aspartyl-tRNA(Asn)/glutamyl-tRNA(Gln) amidotransferase subunit B
MSAFDTSLLVRGYEVVIGLETHVQLATSSKIFSGASTAFGAPANTQACAIDLALPGTLPVLNKAAVKHAIRFGLAIDAQVAPCSIFARKNYFYPDLPKGYQISQYEIPVVQGGHLDIHYTVGQASKHKHIRITRAHLEEDAGKSLHDDFIGPLGEKSSGIDLNRAGTPLLEIVSEPDMRSSTEAVAYARALHSLVVWLGICDGNMQEGSFRCDANVSVRKPGAPLGTRREIKNLNSFRFLQQAMDYEIQWQIEQLEDGLDITQATVLFNPDSGQTRAMRSKEDAHDYRYFPDPDLPPLVISDAWVEQERQAMPELPAAMQKRLTEQDQLPVYDAQILTQTRAMATYYDAVRATGAPAKLVANWMMGELSKRLNAEDLEFDQCPLPPAYLGALMQRIEDNTLSNNSARQVLEAIWSGSGTNAYASAAQAGIDEVIDRLGLRQVNDTQAIETLADEVIAANEKSVQEYRSGKEKAFNALVGQVMKASKGKANPAQASEILKRKLG